MSDQQFCFYGLTLSASKQSETWVPVENNTMYSKKLVINLAVLGADAKQDELNVVQVTTKKMNGDIITIPIAILKTGEMQQARPDVAFTNAPVTFTLLQGSGPVHLVGKHVADMDGLADLLDGGGGDE